MRHLSDEEYIAKIRKRVNTVNRFRWFWPILFLSFFACLIKFVDLIQKIEPNPDNHTVMGFAIGITFGMFLVFTTVQAAHCLRNWWEAYRGWRTERLLLKYYDEKEANHEEVSRVSTR
ncbi:MAG: hypothetical protein WCK89_13645 [bacterium]